MHKFCQENLFTNIYTCDKIIFHIISHVFLHLLVAGEVMWGIFCSNTYFPAHRFSLSSLYVCFCFAYPCTLHEIYYIFHILLSIQFYFFGILYIFIFAFSYIFMFTVILPILKYFWQKISEIIVTSEILIKYVL